MTNDTVQQPNSQTQRWIVLVSILGSLLLLIGQRLTENDGWLSETPLRVTLWYSLTLIVTTSLALLVTDVRRVVPWIYSLFLALIVGLQATIAGNGCAPDIGVNCGPVIGPYAVALTVSSFLALPFVQAWQHARKPTTDYQLLFEYSWHNALALVLSAAFLGLFWLLLLLWAGLFSLLNIDFFANLFQEDIFIYPVSGLVTGIGIAIARTRTDVLASVREHSLFWIFKSLTPLLAIITVLFLAAIGFVGIEVLWATGTAGLLLAWLAVAIIVFINAVFLNGRNPSHYSAPIRTLINLALLGLPIIAALGFWAVSLRVEQYGWSAARLWAAYVMALLLVYGIGYAIAVIRSTLKQGGIWLGYIKPHNTLVALFIIASLSAINLGLPSVYNIAVSSQMHRLTSGETTWQALDFKELRFNSGIQGYNAVVAFNDNPGKENSGIELSEHGQRYLQDIIDSQNSWDTTLSSTSESEQRLAMILQDGVTVPEGLIDFILEQHYNARECSDAANRCALIQVALRRNGEPDWLFMFDNKHSKSWLLYNQVNGNWQNVAQLNPYGANNRNAFDSVLKGEFGTAEPEWRDMTVNGERIKIRP